MSCFFYLLGDSWGEYGDAIHYLSLYNGNEAPYPWSQRLLTPYLSSILPFSPKINFLIINYTALALTSCLLFLLFDSKKNNELKFLLLSLWFIAYPFTYNSTAIIRVDPIVYLGISLVFYLSKVYYNLFLNLFIICIFSFSHTLMIISSAFIAIFIFFESNLFKVKKNYIHIFLYLLTPFSINYLFYLYFGSVDLQSNPLNNIKATIQYSNGIFTHTLRFVSTFGPLFIVLFFYIIKTLNRDSLIIILCISITYFLSLLAADTLRVASYSFIIVIYYSSKYLLELKRKNFIAFILTFIFSIIYFFVLGLNLKSIEDNLINLLILMSCLILITFTLSFEFLNQLKNKIGKY